MESHKVQIPAENVSLQVKIENVILDRDDKTVMELD